MAIYAGGTNYKLVLGRSVCEMKLYASTPITNGFRLLSSDDYTLMDSKMLYVTATEYTNSVSADGCFLQDIEDKYLAIKKG